MSYGDVAKVGSMFGGLGLAAKLFGSSGGGHRFNQGPSALSQFQGINTQSPEGISSAQAAALGKTSGEQIYELQRRRLAQQGQGQQRNLARMFAGRGGGASSASASAMTRQLAAERDAVADASLQSQIEGQKIGMAEAQRLAQQQQFGAQLQQSSALANLQARTQLSLGDQANNRAFQQMLLQQQQAKSGRRSGLLGSLFKGAGAIGGFMLGGPAGAGLGMGLGGAAGGAFESAAPDQQYNPQVYG